MTGWQRLVAVVVGVAITGAAACVFGTQQRDVVAPAVVRTRLGSKIDTYLARLTAFGFSGAVIVTTQGGVQIAKGYGLANPERGIPCNANTVFTVGAVSWFTDGKPWAIFTVEDLVYNVDVQAYIRAKGQ